MASKRRDVIHVIPHGVKTKRFYARGSTWRQNKEILCTWFKMAKQQRGQTIYFKRKRERFYNAEKAKKRQIGIV